MVSTGSEALRSPIIWAYVLPGANSIPAMPPGSDSMTLKEPWFPIRQQLRFTVLATSGLTSMSSRSHLDGKRVGPT